VLLCSGAIFLFAFKARLVLLVMPRSRKMRYHLRRRQHVESFWSGNDRRYEVIWLGRLEEVVQFYYKHGRLPKCDVEGKEGMLARWMWDQRKAKHCLDEGKSSTHKMTPDRIDTLQAM
jgi:hypothetical protein